MSFSNSVRLHNLPDVNYWNIEKTTADYSLCKQCWDKKEKSKSYTVG